MKLLMSDVEQIYWKKCRIYICVYAAAAIGSSGDVRNSIKYSNCIICMFIIVNQGEVALSLTSNGRLIIISISFQIEYENQHLRHGRHIECKEMLEMLTQLAPIDVTTQLESDSRALQTSWLCFQQAHVLFKDVKYHHKQMPIYEDF